jgi:hypothetical protein
VSADWEWFDGLDAYGPTGFLAVDAGVPKPEGVALLGGEWNNILADGLAVTAAGTNCVVVDALTGVGRALRVDFNFSGAGSAGGLGKTLGGNFGGVMVGGVFQTDLQNLRKAFMFSDAGAWQCAVTIETNGKIGVRTADGSFATDGEVLALSEDSVSSYEAFSLVIAATFPEAGGSVKVWLNGHVILDETGLPTRSTPGETVDAVEIWIRGTNLQNPPAIERGTWIALDHVYIRAWEAAVFEDPLPLPMVETAFPIADDTQHDFAFGAAVLGDTAAADDDANAPGANQLVLRRYTPDADGQLDEVWVLPAATSAGAKFTPCVYSDAAGVADARLTTGPEVVGCAAGVLLEMPLTTPQALVAGTAIWLGYIVDTSVAVAVSEIDGVSGRRAASAYGSGAPATAPALVVGPSWVIFGIVSGVADDFWSVIDENPAAGDLSYLTSDAIGDQDLYIFPELSSTPTTIIAVKIAAVMRRVTGGASEVDLQMVSGGVTGAGSDPGLTPSGGYATIASYFTTDPDTGAAWNASGVNLAKVGYEITG